MEFVIFEKKAFEEMAAKLENFMQRVDNLCHRHGGKKPQRWLDHQEVCQALRISKRTLQTLRDNGTLAYTKIGNRTFYRSEDVERVIVKVEDRSKEACWNGRTI